MEAFSADATAVDIAALDLSASQSEASSDAVSAAADDVESEWSTDDVDIHRHHLSQQRVRAPRLSEVQFVALRAEGDAKGYGRMYAAMGGGREGLEACAAGEHWVTQRGCPLPLVHRSAGLPELGSYVLHLPVMVNNPRCDAMDVQSHGRVGSAAFACGFSVCLAIINKPLPRGWFLTHLTWRPGSRRFVREQRHRHAAQQLHPAAAKR